MPRLPSEWRKPKPKAKCFAMWRKSSMASAKCGLSRLMKTILCSKSKKVKTRWLSTAVTISQSHWYYVVTARVLK
ncbi:Uncharacterised protein [Vibrio cholerae]|nr:Uncharacterised protein [Vibrio cholerae]